MARPKRLGPYAPLSATYASDDAILEAGERAELLYVRGLAFCAAAESDGYLTEAQMVRFVGAGMTDARARANKLVAVGLWERTDGGYAVRGWLKWNKSSEEIGRERRRDRERKKTPDDPDPDPDSSPPPRRNPAGTQPESHPHSSRNPNGIQTEPPRESHPDSAPAPGHAPAQACARPIHSTPLHSNTALRAADAAAPERTPTQRSKVITDAYAAAEPMCTWSAINAIAIKAIKADRWTDEEVRDALLRLATDGRPVTVNTLRIELDGLPPSRAAPSSRAGIHPDQRVQEIQALKNRGNPDPPQLELLPRSAS